MKIIIFEVEVDYWPRAHTARFAVLSLDNVDWSSSLLDIGWYQGNFYFDLFFWRYIRWEIMQRIIDWKNED
jgi:hypothetical protein